MAYELKPCPFCGSDVEINGKKFYRVVCGNCGAVGGDATLPSKAVELWNKRAQKVDSRCKNCKHYREEHKWCDNLSVYLDEDDNPTLEETGRWIAFKPDDYCSNWEAKDE